MANWPLLAAVDLGSNSFRLQFASVIEGKICLGEGVREPVRLAAGLDPQGNLDVAARERALACLARFRELLIANRPAAVRVVATNTLRIAGNAGEFLPQAETALGWPIEIISGAEEARLIYLGVAHSLPPSDERRLVMDIGGGSTELIIGQCFQPHLLDSLQMGCVGFTRRFFPDGKITETRMNEAIRQASELLRSVADKFSRTHWESAYGSAGTACVVSQILQLNGYSDGSLTRTALGELRVRLTRQDEMGELSLSGIKPDRILALPGGFAILFAIFDTLGIESMRPALSALREGLLYDVHAAVEK